MYTTQGWLKRTRKRHLVQIVILLSCLAAFAVLEARSNREILALHTIQQNLIALIDAIPRTVNPIADPQALAASQQAFSEFAVTFRQQHPKFFEFQSTRLSAISNALRQLGNEANESQLIEINAAVRGLISDIAVRQRSLMQNNQTLEYGVLFVAFVAVILFVFSLGKTFETVTTHYNHMTRRVVQRARDAKKRLQKALDIKQQLLFSIQHELRSPISSVVGCLEIIQDTQNPEVQQKYIERARSATFQLLREVDSLTQIADLDNPYLGINKKEFNLLFLVEQYAAEASVACKHASKTLDVDFEPDKSMTIKIDAQKLLAVLTGVGKQVVQSSSSSIIKLSVNLVGDRESGMTLNFEFSATSPNSDAFRYRELWEDPTNSDFEKAGLSSFVRVPLLKHYCELLETTTHYHVDEYSVKINLQIDLDQDDIGISEIDLSHDLTGHYAVVDDLSTSRDLLTHMLEHAGALVTTFNTGRELLNAMQDNKRFDGIILDIHMPELSGVEVLDNLNALYSDMNTPIFMMSADHELLNRSLTKNPMVEQVFSKPVDSQRFLDTLQVREHQQLNTEQKKLRILLVEDDPISAELVSQMLTSFGYAVITAPTGTIGKQALSKHNFDVALIDLNLPDMNGYDLAKFVNDEVEHERRPVMLALTANTLERDREKSMQAGMKYHLCKPLPIQELRKAIQLSVATS